MNTGRFQRKNLLINPRMQIKYVAAIIACFIIITLFLTWEWYFYLSHDKTISAVIAQDPALRLSLLMEFKRTIVKIICLSFGFAFLGLYFTNHIAGPVHRLSKVILRMAEHADLTVSFNLREKDELQEVARALNTMVQQFRQRLINDDDLREKVRITSKAMIHLLKNKRKVSDEEIQKLVQAGSLLLQESSQSPIQFKI